MARYEYLCRDCGSTFELQRPMTDAEGEVRCPAGHGQVRRRFTVHAVAGGQSPAPIAPSPAPSAGGGCCGGGCGCR
ncbi:MAG TPA: zinc ribbon domain-containing protein [Acidimicrobiales bacterium]|nr:zinc ribbon domain-containing protein [Acidimicrobiales bacterium]